VRILHVVPGVSLAFGGPGNLIGLIRGLRNRGVDATLLTTNADVHGRLDVPLNQLVMRDGVPHVFHHVWKLGGRYGFAPGMIRTLWKTIAAYDLVHIHWLYNFSCIAAARAALAAGVPVVVQPHGSLDPHLRRKNSAIKRIYMATVGRPLLRRPAAVVFTAEQERMLASYGPRRPEWIIPAGIDGPLFRHLPPRGSFRAAFPDINGPFLLFLGRVSPQKGLDLLLGAFERIIHTRQNVWLVIAGPDYRGYETQARRLARDLGVDTRVLFTGMLTHEMKLAAFVDADLFVLPSYAENFGVVIMEALACGLPVLISDQVNIHRELSAAGVATVVTCSIGSVAEGIAAALADAGARRRVATLGPAFVNTHYTWDAIVPKLIEKYTEVIAASRLSGGARTRWEPAI
jgi:glycosyltransferase involved in cell wall biosynthesis